MKTHSYPPRKILVPTDLGPISEHALAFARYFHERHGAGITVLHAQHLELPPYFSSGQLEALKREWKRSGKAAADYVRRAGEAVLGFTPDVTVIENAPVDAILESAGSFDLVIMGTHGRHGAQRMWLGSVAERVLRESVIPVLAVRRPPAAAPFQRILCPVNLTEVGESALEFAGDIAAAAGSHLIVLHALEKGEKPLDCPLVGDPIKRRCTVEEVIRHGSAAKIVLEAADHLRPDVIVMGAERKRALMGELFSSTTASVMQWADAPLLIVPVRARAATC